MLYYCSSVDIAMEGTPGAPAHIAETKFRALLAPERARRDLNSLRPEEYSDNNLRCHIQIITVCAIPEVRMRNITSEAVLSLTATVKAFEKKVNPPVDSIASPSPTRSSSSR